MRQLTALAKLFKRALDYCLPKSVAVLGVAGGNGLEQINGAITRRVIGLDINQQYLDEVRRRFGAGQFAGLEIYCRDLTEPHSHIAPVALVHAALIFEHIGLGVALENALALVASGGHFSVVLQLPSEEPAVSSTSYTTMQALNLKTAVGLFV